MTFSHEFNPSSLREYDIRGIVGDTLLETDAFAIGRTFGSIVAENGGKRVAVGRDGRLSSPSLEAKLIEGLVASGMEVIAVGQRPHPDALLRRLHRKHRRRGNGDRQPQPVQL